jgi:hypothetical protein
LIYYNSNNLGWLKIKLHNQSNWHRRYCIIDWDKAVLFIATRADTRYRDWIKISPKITINDDDYSLNNELNNNNLSISIIEIKSDGNEELVYYICFICFCFQGTTATHLLQVETKNDYDGWLLALKQTAYSRTGGGECFLFKDRFHERNVIVLYFYKYAS